MDDEQRALLAAIVEASDEAIYTRRLDGTILSWNAAAERVYGFTAAEMLGQSLDRIVPEDKREELRLLHERLRRGERVSRFDTVRVNRDGHRFDVSLSVSPLVDPHGNVFAAASIAHDVSWKKQAEEELARARDAAIVANRAKDHLLAVLSHELRTPLTPALAAIGLLGRDSTLSSAARAKVDAIRRNLELEAKLVDDLLDLTSVVRGTSQLVRKPTAVAPILDHAIAICEPDRATKGLRFELDTEDALFIEADEVRMQQVVWSLLRNAIRFSELGGAVRISAKRNVDEIVIEVSDDGEGIEADRLARLFSPLDQGPTTGATRGIAIGLAAARALIEAHDGQLEVSSSGRGRGATFRITLPAHAPASRRVPQLEPSSARPRVLLVEDHPDTAELLQEILELAELDVKVAYTAALAIAELEDGAFDLVVSDLGLPDRPGHDVARAARAKHPGVRIIALSGYGTAEDRRETAEAGFDEHLTKPISVADLQSAVARLLGPRSG